MSKKTEVIERLLSHCQQKQEFSFDNELVKQVAGKVGFKNPFDVTHIDSSAKLPEPLKEQDYFILHTGKGKHRFVKGIRHGYHQFEPITEQENWPYRASVLNELNTSEANILSVAYNQRIIHQFLYGDVAAAPKIYISHRTKFSCAYRIHEQEVSIEKQQIEIDMTAEENGMVTVFEAKNGFPFDFAIYQIYLPILYYAEMRKQRDIKTKAVNACYLLRKQEDSKGSTIRLYLYAFTDPYEMTSLRLLRSKEYRLTRRS